MKLFNQKGLTVITTLYYKDPEDKVITVNKDDNTNIYYNKVLDSVIIDINKRKAIIPMHRVLVYEVA